MNEIIAAAQGIEFWLGFFIALALRRGRIANILDRVTAPLVGERSRVAETPENDPRETDES